MSRLAALFLKKETIVLELDTLDLAPSEKERLLKLIDELA